MVGRGGQGQAKSSTTLGALARKDLDRSEGRGAGRPRFDGPLLPIGSGIGVVGGVGIEPTRGRAIEWTRPAPVLPSGTWRESHSCIKEIGGKRETPRTGRLIRDSSHSTERGAVGQTRTTDVDADAARREGGRRANVAEGERKSERPSSVRPRRPRPRLLYGIIRSPSAANDTRCQFSSCSRHARGRGRAGDE